MSLFDFLPVSRRELRELKNQLSTLMATQAEHQVAIDALTAQVTKSKAEIVARVTELETAVASGGNTSPAVDTAFTNLKTAVQGVDDLNTDAQA